MWLRKQMFGISPQEATFARRKFSPGPPAAQAHLERIGAVFLTGYHGALDHADLGVLGAQLRRTEMALQGFAFEGAAMGLTLLDILLPGRRDRLTRFLAGPGEPHTYMVYVGAGWALARLRRPIEPMLKRSHPVLGWLVVDGYGFHEGYFHGPRYVRQHLLPRRLSGYALRAFDQGLGRSLWFVEGADVERLIATVDTFPVHRQLDLWSGVGLACAYAGGVERAAVQRLLHKEAAFRGALAQGVAFAVQARLRAGNPVAHTEMACEVVCGMDMREAAALTEAALQALPPDAGEPAYELWRQRIQRHFATEPLRVHVSSPQHEAQG